MRKHDLVIGLIVLEACVPKIDRDDTEGRHYSGAEWQIDREGNVVAMRTVLVERNDAGHGRVIASGSDGTRVEAENLVTLAGSLRGGVLRVVEMRASGKRVIDLTPLGDDEFAERVRIVDASATAPP